MKNTNLLMKNCAIYIFNSYFFFIFVSNPCLRYYEVENKLLKIMIQYLFCPFQIKKQKED